VSVAFTCRRETAGRRIFIGYRSFCFCELSVVSMTFTCRRETAWHSILIRNRFVNIIAKSETSPNDSRLTIHDSRLTTHDSQLMLRPALPHPCAILRLRSAQLSNRNSQSTLAWYRQRSYTWCPLQKLVI
jgi:hypothetical protein